MAWVYILRTHVGRYYIGSTDNLVRRLKQHNNNHTATTARQGIDKLVFSKEYQTLGEARAVEHKLKKLKRKDYIEKIIKEGYIKVQP